MNIAVIGLRGIPGVQGGIEKHCEELYSRIAKNGVGITVIGREGYIRPDPYTYNGIQVVPIWAPRSKSMETMVHTGLCCIWLIKNRIRFSIVHVHAIGPSLFTPFLRRCGLKVVVTNHGPEYNRQKWGGMAKSMLKISEYIGSKTAHRIIAVSRQIQYALTAKYAVKAHYIPNGVVQPEIIPCGATLKEFGLKSNKYVLCVGRLVPEKGFHDLIEAFNKIETDWKLTVAGEADHEDAYSRSLKSMANESDKVIMTGFQKGNALEELYSNAGLFVLPSYHEGLPIVVLEAMSYDLPLLLSDIPANMEIASPGESFPAGDVNALREKMKTIIENPKGYSDAENFKARRRRLSSEFDWNRIAKQTMGVYAALNP